MGKILDLLGLTITEQSVPDQEREINPATGIDPTKPPTRTERTSTFTVDNALKLSAVARAIQIHVIATKQMGIDAVDKNGQPKKTTPRILKKPSNEEPLEVTLEKSVFSAASRGNFYWRKFYYPQSPDELINNRPKTISNIVVLDPDQVTIDANKYGVPVNYNFGEEKIAPADIIHGAIGRRPGDPLGYGPIQQQRIELSGIRDVTEYAANWFNESGVPSGIIETDQVFDDQSAKDLKDQWQSTNGGRDGVAVLGNGYKYRTNILDPAAAQWLESQQFDITKICRMFGVPASLMLAQVDGSSMTYQNVDQDWLGFIKFSHMQYIIELENALSQLLPGAGRVKFNIEALLRSDTITRYTAHKLAIDGGWLDPNEVRDIENLTPKNVVPAASTNFQTGETK